MMTETDATLSETEINLLKMLFEEHHRQLTSLREKIHGITEKTLVLFLVVAGWLVSTKDPLTSGVRWIIPLVVVVVAGGSVWNVYVNNAKYHTIAQVVSGINHQLGFFGGKAFFGTQVYPPGWKNFGERGRFLGALTHIMAIIAAAVLCVFAAFRHP